MWDVIRLIHEAHPFGVASLFKIAPGDFVFVEQGNLRQVFDLAPTG